MEERLVSNYKLPRALVQIAIIVVSLVGGVLLVFSDFVIRALGDADAASGAQVMQFINQEVSPSAFGVLLLGQLGLCIALVVLAYRRLKGASRTFTVLGATAYFVGITSTLMFNVPLNEQLRVMDLSHSDTLQFWKQTYLPNWTLWNHLRVLLCLASAIFYSIALFRMKEKK